MYRTEDGYPPPSRAEAVIDYGMLLFIGALVAAGCYVYRFVPQWVGVAYFLSLLALLFRWNWIITERAIRRKQAADYFRNSQGGG
jgi:hypothetical protein